MGHQKSTGEWSLWVSFTWCVCKEAGRGEDSATTCSYNARASRRWSHFAKTTVATTIGHRLVSPLFRFLFIHSPHPLQVQGPNGVFLTLVYFGSKDKARVLFSGRGPSTPGPHPARCSSCYRSGEGGKCNIDYHHFEGATICRCARLA